MTQLTGFVDLQVNGYAGVDFNSMGLTTDACRKACEALRHDGVKGILATVVSAEISAMTELLAKIVSACNSDPFVREVIEGIHIEGPFLNETPGFIGAHPPTAVIPANLDVTKRLLEAAGGLTRIVTLAPERDEGSVVTRFLADEGIVVSAGHCDASETQLKSAVDAGLSMFTHLGNGCPEQLRRHDNIIQRVLALNDQLWVSFIGDGIHIPFFALRNYLHCTNLRRSIIVTDAVAPTGLEPGLHHFAGREVLVDEAGVTRYPGVDSHLVGSVATMPQIADRLQREIGLSESEIAQLTCEHPREILNNIPKH